MSEFGDFTPDDAFDTAAPEPEALARAILHAEKRLTKDENRPDELEELGQLDRVLRIFVAAFIIERLTHEGVIPGG